MNKKPAAKPLADEANSTGQPRRRSKLKLAALFAVPFLLAAGGAGGWVIYSGYDPEAAEAAAAGQDHFEVSAIPVEVIAESSFTHSYALSMLVERQCGRSEVEALKIASDAEAHANGTLATLSWAAATRRMAALNADTCPRFLGEIRRANGKALEAISGPGKTGSYRH